MPKNEDFQGVSNCYVFKSQLQEYAQKVGIPTPVYETIKEGPSHEPSFKSTVIVDNVRYDSLLGFSNRKKAEHSAAEVALGKLAKSGHANPSISQPIHETGLCKNLLQEYAQKMNYAMPSYHCQKEETRDRVPLFSCMVEIGGIRYVGAAANTKKEAEIKVARTALLAIQSSKSEASAEPVGDNDLTVLPSKKRRAEENADIPKPKKARRRKRKPNKKFSKNKVCQAEGPNAGNWGGHSEISGGETGISVKPLAAFRLKKTVAAFRLEKRMGVEATPNGHNWMSHLIPSVNQTSAWEHSFVPRTDGTAENGQSIAPCVNLGNRENLDAGASASTCGTTTPQVNDAGTENWQPTTSVINNGQEGGLNVGKFADSFGNITHLAQELNMVSGVEELVPREDNADIPKLEASSVMAGPNQSKDESKPQELNVVSGAPEPVSVENNSNIPYLEASNVMPGLNQSKDESEPGEVNMVSAAVEPVSIEDNTDIPKLEASSVMVGPNQSKDESKPQEVNMVSGAAEPVSVEDDSNIPYLEASSVMPGLNQSKDESEPGEVKNMVSEEPVSVEDNSNISYLEAASVMTDLNQLEDEFKPHEVNMMSGAVEPVSLADNSNIPDSEASCILAAPN